MCSRGKCGGDQVCTAHTLSDVDIIQSNNPSITWWPLGLKHKLWIINNRYYFSLKLASFGDLLDIYRDTPGIALMLHNPV